MTGWLFVARVLLGRGRWRALLSSLERRFAVALPSRSRVGSARAAARAARRPRGRALLGCRRGCGRGCRSGGACGGSACGERVDGWKRRAGAAVSWWLWRRHDSRRRSTARLFHAVAHATPSLRRRSSAANRCARPGITIRLFQWRHSPRCSRLWAKVSPSGVRHCAAFGGRRDLALELPHPPQLLHLQITRPLLRRLPLAFGGAERRGEALHGGSEARQLPLERAAWVLVIGDHRDGAA